jgi:hypothetical protein
MPPPPPDALGSFAAASRARFGLSRLLGARLRLRQSTFGAPGDVDAASEATEGEDNDSEIDGATEAGEDVEVYRAHKFSRAGVRHSRRLALDRSTFSIRQLSKDGGIKWIVPVGRLRESRRRAECTARLLHACTAPLPSGTFQLRYPSLSFHRYSAVPHPPPLRYPR